MAGERYRLVDVRLDLGEETFVHGTVLSHDEAIESLETEAYIHRAAGWAVTEKEDSILCKKGPACRLIEIVRFEPMNDSQI